MESTPHQQGAAPDQIATNLHSVHASQMGRSNLNPRHLTKIRVPLSHELDGRAVHSMLSHATTPQRRKNTTPPVPVGRRGLVVSKWDKYDPDAEGDEANDGIVFERSEYEVLRSRACLPHTLRRVLDYLKQGLAMPPTQGVGAARTARGQRQEARLGDGARLVDRAQKA